MSKPTVQEFKRDRLLISLYKSLGHRRTAVTDAAALADTVVMLLVKQAEGAITSHYLAQTAHSVLKRFDSAAATHYAAFHASRF
jgi:transcriptional regulator NrdR family protein